jgi:hypothetical protein
VGLTTLEERLQQSDPDLFAHYMVVAEKARELLARVYSTFPQYTDHAWTHARQVVKLLERLCTCPAAGNLTPPERGCPIGS